MNERKRYNRLRDSSRTIYHEAKNYVVDGWLRGEMAGLEALKAPLLGGRLYWPGLIMLLLAALGAAAILGCVLSRARLAQGRRRILLFVLGPVAGIAFLSIYELFHFGIP